jgi:hypothetical protein
MSLLGSKEAKIGLEGIVKVKEWITHKAFVNESVDISSDLHEAFVDSVLSWLPKLLANYFTQEATPSNFNSWNRNIFFVRLFIPNTVCYELLLSKLAFFRRCISTVNFIQ